LFNELENIGCGIKLPETQATVSTSRRQILSVASDVRAKLQTISTTWNLKK